MHSRVLDCRGVGVSAVLGTDLRFQKWGAQITCYLNQEVAGWGAQAGVGGCSVPGVMVPPLPGCPEGRRLSPVHSRTLSRGEAPQILCRGTWDKLACVSFREHLMTVCK